MEGMGEKLPMVRVSALQGEGIDDLLRCISEKLLLQFIALDVLIPCNHCGPFASLRKKTKM
jgi:GTPase